MITIKMLTQYAWRPGIWFGGLSLPWLVLGVVSLGVWAVQLVSGDGSASIVFPSLTVLFVFLFGSFLSLSVLSEMYLNQADRTYLKSLVDVLTVAENVGANEGAR